MLLDVESQYLEALLRSSLLLESTDFNYENSADCKAQMTSILEKLNLPNTDMPFKIIANINDAENVFKYAVGKCQKIEDFIKSNFQVLRKVDDVMGNRQQTDQVSIGGKMLYAKAHKVFAQYQNDNITKQTLLNSALESLLTLKKDIKVGKFVVDQNLFVEAREFFIKLSSVIKMLHFELQTFKHSINFVAQCHEFGAQLLDILLQVLGVLRLLQQLLLCSQEFQIAFYDVLVELPTK